MKKNRLFREKRKKIVFLKSMKKAYALNIKHKINLKLKNVKHKRKKCAFICSIETFIELITFIICIGTFYCFIFVRKL